MGFRCAVLTVHTLLPELEMPGEDGFCQRRAPIHYLSLDVTMYLVLSTYYAPDLVLCPVS